MRWLVETAPISLHSFIGRDSNLTEEMPEQALGIPADFDLSDSDVRFELVDKILQSLLEDADRCEGELARADVNRAYFRRNLTISECAEVEKALHHKAINIIEGDEEGDGEDEEFTRVNSIPLPAKAYLTESEEIDCGRKIQFAKKIKTENTDVDPAFSQRVYREAAEAKKRFAESNLRYVWKLARQMARGQHLTTEDLFQEGMIGLHKATGLWDPELGFRFKTYATWWIQQSMHRAKDNGDRTVRIPVHLKTKLNRIRRTRSKLAGELGRFPTLDELAAVLGMQPHSLQKLMWRVHITNVVEADAPVGEETTMLDLRADDEAETAFDRVADLELHDVLQEILLQLAPREERIIRMRFGFGDNQDRTLDTIGQQFGVTRERIRQIEAKAMKKLMNPFRMRMLKSFFDS